MKSRLLGARAGAALCSIASQASASIVDVVYAGQVQAGGVDPFGVFNAGTKRRTNPGRTEHSINTSEHYLTS
jgi:hypothetical protein